ncbi:hypothetical protein [Clostridium estertheticum]|nr:hypothetical protein [Clostridium estertheticum]MBU3186010.1 hypothetical protein [Clostridium estertheticum]
MKENDNQMAETVHNVARDPNIGQKLDVVAGVHKDKNEAAKNSYNSN